MQMMKPGSKSPYLTVATILLVASLAWVLGAPGPSLGEAPDEKIRRVNRPATVEVPPSREGRELVGKAASPWGELIWLNSARLSLSDLRGKVVLIRF